MKAKAFAKINLYLDVIDKRSDGYHNIDSVMQSVSLCDDIEIDKRMDGEVVIRYNDPGFWRDDDIILKAVDLFFNFSNYRCGLDIYIEKRIPTEAGLGGFSADVSTVLKMLNIISGKNYPDDIMLSLCKSLGADMPFCYNGGTARVGAIGDDLEKLPTRGLFFVLLKEGNKKSTGDMYSHLDSLKIPFSNRIEQMLKGIKDNDLNLICQSVYNVFENCWEIDKMKEPFSEFSPNAVFLSGSGPTVAAAFTEKERAEDCYNRLKTDSRNVFFAKTADCGNMIE